MRKSCFLFKKKRGNNQKSYSAALRQKIWISEPQKITLGLSITPNAEAAAVLVSTPWEPGGCAHGEGWGGGHRSLVLTPGIRGRDVALINEIIQAVVGKAACCSLGPFPKNFFRILWAFINVGLFSLQKAGAALGSWGPPTLAGHYPTVDLCSVVYFPK